MKKLAIICNSTASLSEKTKQNEHVYVLPLQIIHEDKSYKDLEELSLEQTYELIKSGKLLTTSQPSIGEAESLIAKLSEEYEQVLYIAFASVLSGTYQTGVMVKSMLEKNNISVFDSEAASLIEEGFVKYALSHAHLPVESIILKLEKLKANVRMFLMVEDLNHLQRSGRITKAASFIGNLAKIKPILEVTKEGIIPYEKIRTTKKAYDFLLSELKDVNENDYVIIVDAQCPEGVAYTKSKLEEINPNLKINCGFLSPVISVHTGLGALGLGFIKDFYKEEKNEN